MAQPKYNKKFKSIKGKQMAYIDEGDGDPIVTHMLSTESIFSLCSMRWKQDTASRTRD